MKKRTASYQNNEEKPYLHLVDGGLTDNLGLASLLDMSNLLTVKKLYAELKNYNLRNIVVVNVNVKVSYRAILISLLMCQESKKW